MNIITIIAISIFGGCALYSIIMLFVGLLRKRKIKKQIEEDSEDENE